MKGREWWQQRAQVAIIAPMSVAPANGMPAALKAT
jgi:hypothetical protein